MKYFNVSKIACPITHINPPVKNARTIVKACLDLGISFLTVFRYSLFSIELYFLVPFIGEAYLFLLYYFFSHNITSIFIFNIRGLNIHPLLLFDFKFAIIIDICSINISSYLYRTIINILRSVSCRLDRWFLFILIV